MSRARLNEDSGTGYGETRGERVADLLTEASDQLIDAYESALSAFLWGFGDAARAKIDPANLGAAYRSGVETFGRLAQPAAAEPKRAPKKRPAKRKPPTKAERQAHAAGKLLTEQQRRDLHQVAMFGSLTAMVDDPKGFAQVTAVYAPLVEAEMLTPHTTKGLREWRLTKLGSGVVKWYYG